MFKNFFKIKKTNGFTLIELLVVISIIGLLSTLAVVALKNARMKARDTKRLADMKQIQLSLDLYHDKNTYYPGWTSSYGESEVICGGWDTSTVDNDGDGKPFIEPLIDDGFMKQVPVDPRGGGICGGYQYRYYRYPAGGDGCDASRGDYYVLGISDLEATGWPHPASPGWQCSGRNWQGEFEWVTGRFTN